MSEIGRRLQAEAIRWHADARARAHLPLEENFWEDLTGTGAHPSVDQLLAQAEDFQPPVRVIELLTQHQWDNFDGRMRYAHRGQMGPWNRIVSILRGHDAKCCIVEENYVCLDYRSELASFYAQLDAPLSRASIRLHFFEKNIPKSSFLSLSADECASYLGYVVCRGGTLPLVGRTVLKAPKYVIEPASIEETIYFFGQRLTVWGVPFMQQDERFANCAQVSAWTTNYSAYRRGLVERRLIADFVALSRSYRPMRPYPSIGLMAPQVAELIKETGMRAEVWWTPTGNVESYYPHTTVDQVPGAALLVNLASNILEGIVERVMEEIASEPGQDEPQDSCPSPASTSIRTATDLGLVPRAAASSLPDFASDLLNIGLRHSHDDLIEIASELQDLLIDYLTAPFIRSRWPIYCDTKDHALVLSGRANSADGRPIFFFHDDQFGPYLASRHAFAASKGDFQYQAFILESDGSRHDRTEGAPSKDRAHSVISGEVAQDDDQRGVQSLVIPCPTRLLLDPIGAEDSAHRLMSRALEDSVGDVRVTLLMGTDFKDLRLEEARRGLVARGFKKEATAAVSLYSAMHLAEWVVLVEGVRDDGSIPWEVAFDGSSGSSNPLIQYARCDDSVVVYPPGSTAKPQILTIEDLRFTGVKVPSRLGKGRRLEPRDSADSRQSHTPAKATKGIN